MLGYYIFAYLFTFWVLADKPYIIIDKSDKMTGSELFFLKTAILLFSPVTVLIIVFNLVDGELRKK